MRTTRFAVALIVLAGLIVGIGLAGPVLMDEQKLPDDAMSLAGLEKLAVDIEPFPGSLTDKGLNADLIRNRWVKLLEQADFDVVEGGRHPRLWMKVRAGSEPAVPGGYAFVVEMKLFQRVHIERLGRTLNVSTYTTGALGMVPNKDLRRDVERALDKRIRKFIELTKQATRQAGAEVTSNE